MGRRPLRSSFAPTMRPSLKTSAAGPSHGSCSRVAFCRKRRSFGPVCGSLSHAGGTMRSIAAATLEPCAEQNFERIVETGGVADAFFQHAKLIRCAEFLPQRAFTRARPAAIGADGIDFAVVRDEAERLRELPRRTGVGGIALVKNREGRDEIRARRDPRRKRRAAAA